MRGHLTGRRFGMMRADAPGRRRRQHADPLRHVPRRRAGRALALCDRADVDRRRARRRAAQPAGAARRRAGGPRRVDRLLHGAAAGARVAGDGGHYLGHRMLAVGPGIRTGMPIKIDNPRELGADRLVNAVAAYERLGGPCISVDFGTAVNFDVVSAQGEYIGGVSDARRGDLARRADRAAAPSCRASTSSRRAARDRQGHGRRDPLRRRLRLRRRRSTAISRASRRSWARRRRRSPPAGWRASSCRTRTRSTRSTTC